jgi:tetratricopeptide (TPR) repeat protein
VNRIVKIIRSSDAAVLCGAGISYNSGLPLAIPLERYMLEKICDLKGKMNISYVNQILHANIPFEGFIQELAEVVELSSIFDIFKHGNPNSNHFLIAKLAKAGVVREIFTTNFDVLLEKAFEAEGLINNSDYKVLFREEHFENMSLINDNYIRLYKIHGCATDQSSIRATIKSISNRTLYSRRKTVLNHMFSSGKYKNLIVLGYSFSDAFDVCQELLVNPKKKKRIFFVEHSDKFNVEPLRKVDKKRGLTAYPGCWFKTNIDILLEDIWCRALKQATLKRDVYPEFWRFHVDEWSKILSIHNEFLKLLILGRLLIKIHDYKSAIPFFSGAMHIEEGLKDDFRKGLVYSGLGIAYRNTGNQKKAVYFDSEALKLSNKTGDYKVRISSLRGIANNLYQRGKYNEAIENYKNALDEAAEYQDRHQESISLQGIGLSYRMLGESQKALKYYRMSLGICTEIGDKEGEAINYSNMGVIWEFKNDLEKAREAFEKSLGVSLKLADPKLTSLTYSNLSSFYGNQGNLVKALDYSKKALKIKRAIVDHIGIITCLTNICRYYIKLDKWTESIKYGNEALEIAFAHDYPYHEAQCCLSLCGSHISKGDVEKAKDYVKRALEIGKMIGSTIIIKKCRNISTLLKL